MYMLLNIKLISQTRSTFDKSDDLDECVNERKLEQALNMTMFSRYEIYNSTSIFEN